MSSVWQESRRRPAGWLAASAEADGGSCVRPPAAAFTLLEILLALGLMALLAAATISVSANLVGPPASPEEVFWQALTQARKEALTTQQDIRLAFDSKTKAFLIGANVGAKTDTDAAAQTDPGTGTQANAGGEPFPVAKAGDKLTVDFLPVDKTNSSVLIGGELLETESIPFVTLYSDGTCTPFRVQFRNGGPASVIAIDPWTCVEVLEEKK
jgi:hypothetical protein